MRACFLVLVLLILAGEIGEKPNAPTEDQREKEINTRKEPLWRIPYWRLKECTFVQESETYLQFLVCYDWKGEPVHYGPVAEIMSPVFLGRRAIYNQPLPV